MIDRVANNHIYSRVLGALASVMVDRGQLPWTDSGALVPLLRILVRSDLTDDEAHYLPLNTELSAQWPVISEMKDAPADADDWKDKPDKLALLER